MNSLCVCRTVHSGCALCYVTFVTVFKRIEIFTEKFYELYITNWKHNTSGELHDNPVVPGHCYSHDIL